MSHRKIQSPPQPLSKILKPMLQQAALDAGADDEFVDWQEYTVDRDGDVPLTFDGFLLGTGTSRVRCVDKLRNAWTERGHEARIFKTKSTIEVQSFLSGGQTVMEQVHRYVVAFTSWSGVSTETDRFKASVATTPTELYDQLRKLTGKGIPDAALFALKNAATADRRLKEIASERI
jgi:hypothetical protein